MRPALSAGCRPRGRPALARTGLGRGAPRRTLAAIFSLPISSSRKSAKRSPSAPLGLPMQSIAPSSSAFTVASAPSRVSVETIRTGIGRRVMIFSRKVSPSIRGISTSSVRTSGLVALIISLASNGSAAWPTTSKPGSADRASVSIRRISALSSTIATRIGLAIINPQTTRYRLRPAWSADPT